MSKIYNYLIVGAGLFGATCARLLTLAGKSVLVIDKNHYVGGLCYDEEIDGIRVNRHGGHIFHTNNDRIWHFVQGVAEWKPYYHKVMVNYRNRIYSFPINFMTIQQVFGVIPKPYMMHDNGRKPTGRGKNARDYAISLLGERLYNIFIQGYTHKQWGIPPEELPASIVKRLPLHLSWNDQYFIDKYQALPTQGYTNFILELLKGSDFIGTANYNTDKPYWNRQAKDIIYTGSLDEFYGYDLGLLPYRSMRHELGRVESGSQIYCATMNYTDYETPYTRIMEWKYFDNRPPKMRHSVYSTEYPLQHKPGETIPVWPINTPENDQLHTRYLDRIGQANWIHIGGRLGSYRYYNMDQTIGAAIDLVGKIGKAL